MNPYEVLGLQPSCSIYDIKKAYKHIALRNHPDKLHDVSEAQRKACEEQFKNATVAYHILIEQHGKVEKQTDPEYWKTMWEKMEIFLSGQSTQHILESIVDVATKYISVKRHKVKLPVSLEDVYNKKERKVEFVLKGVESPVCTVINCGDYPDTSFEYIDSQGKHHLVYVSLLEKQHPQFHIEDGGDLETTVYIPWNDFIEGCDIRIPFFNNTFVATKLTPFQDISQPIVVSGKGINQQHDLVIYVDLQTPCQEAWQDISAPERCMLLEMLKKLFAERT